MDLKKKAQELIKLAEQIEKEASANTFFICTHCNHTASLNEINDRRVKFAAQEDPEINVNPVSINDTVVCPVPGCDGQMEYVATDSSDKYYTEVKDAEDSTSDPMTDDTVKKEEPSKELLDEPEDKEDKADKGDKEDSGDKKDDPSDIDIDKLFEDVETQNEKSKEEKKDKAETTQKARHERTQKKQEDDLLGEDKGPGKPGEEDPLAEPVKKTEPDPLALKEDDVEKEDKPKPKKKKDPVDFDKKDVPKFKSKEAAERYEVSKSRYSV